MTTAASVRYLLVTLLVLLIGREVRADAGECIEAHSNAQVLRDEGQLVASTEAFRRCLASDCPAPVIQECAALLSKVEERLPSVVLMAVDSSGRDLTTVTVSIDGAEPIALDGAAVPVDVGLHQFRFMHPDGRETLVEALAAEFVKARRVEAVFETPEAREAPASPPATPIAPAADSSPDRTLPLILAGVGVLGMVGFATLGSSGRAQEESLRDSCAPSCSKKATEEIASKYLWADVSLAVGVLSLAGGAYFYVDPPGAGPEESAFHVGWQGQF